MNRTFTIAIAVLVAACGCRATANRYPTSAPPVTVSNQQTSVPSKSLAAEQPVDQPGPGTPERRSINEPSHQPVTYQQPAVDGQPVELPTRVVGALDSPLQLEDLERIALENSPALMQADARVDAAEGKWIQAGLPPNPRVGYTGDEMGDEGSAGQQGGFVSQQWITGGKRHLDQEVVAWEIQQQHQRREEVRLRLLTSVRIRFYEVLIAQRRREFAEELVRISDQGVAAADALFRSKEVSQADPLRAKVEADTARIVLQTSINQQMEAWRQLTAVLGTPEMELQPLDGDLTPDLIDLSWQDTLQQILSESPEIAQAAAQAEAAQWVVQRAEAEVIPNVELQAGIARNDINKDTLTSISISLPLPIRNRNQGEIRRAQSEAMAAQLEVDRLQLDLQSRLASAFQQYKSARQQVENYVRKDGVLDSARKTLELIRTGYQAEEFGVLELLTAQKTYFQTNLAYLESLRVLWRSAMEIRGLLLNRADD